MPSKTVVWRVAPAFILASFFTSCSSGGGAHPPSQFDITVKNASTLLKDKEIERSSTALYAFLRGEMEFDKENYQEALKNFKTASELVDDPSPALYSKLAELHVREGDLEKALVESTKAFEGAPEDRKVILLHAGILEALDRSALAEPLYKKLIEREPDQAEAYVLLASLYLRRNEPKRSLDLLQQLKKKSPNEALGYYFLGRTYEDLGDLKNAEQYLDHAYSLDPERTQYSVDLVRVLLKAKKISRVKTLCENILKLEHENIFARRVLGQLLLGENKLDEALQHLKVLEDVEKDPSTTRFKIALIHIERQNFEEAIRELLLVLAQNPEKAEARYYLGSLYASLGQRREAVEELMKISAGGPMYEKSRTLAALIYRQEGQPQKAAEVVREAIENVPQNAELTEFLVLLLRDMEKYSDAANVLEAGIRAQPANEKLLFSYAVVLNDMGREDEALSIMERIISVNPKNAEALNYVAYSFVVAGVQAEKAKEYMERAISIDPKNGYYLDTLGWYHFKRGEFPQAVKHLEKAVAAVSDDVVILEHYADALLSAGDKKKAVEVYRAAVENTREGRGKDERDSRSRIKQRLDSLRATDPDLFPSPPALP